MDPTTTLITFMLHTSCPAFAVYLVGSWDNFSGRYLMEKDEKRGRGQWRGCYAFKNIICEGIEKSRLRNGGLKMGHAYWYYYELDDGTEIHDEALPVTTSCPYLPGQPVNLLWVPLEVRPLRERSASVSDCVAEDVRTMNPGDKFLTPRSPPQPPKMKSRLNTSPGALKRERVSRSASPSGLHSPSSWSPRAFFGRRPQTPPAGDGGCATSPIRRRWIGKPTLIDNTNTNDSNPLALPSQPRDVSPMSAFRARQHSPAGTYNSSPQTTVRAHSPHSPRRTPSPLGRPSSPHYASHDPSPLRNPITPGLPATPTFFSPTGPDSSPSDDDLNFSDLWTSINDSRSPTFPTSLSPTPPLLSTLSSHSQFPILAAPTATPATPPLPSEEAEVSFSPHLLPPITRSHFSIETLSSSSSGPLSPSLSIASIYDSLSEDEGLSDHGFDFDFGFAATAPPPPLAEATDEAADDEAQRAKWGGYSLPRDEDFATQETLRKESRETFGADKGVSLVEEMGYLGGLIL